MLRDRSGPHEGHEETIHISLLGHGGVLRQPLVRPRVVKQGLYLSLILAAITTVMLPLSAGAMTMDSSSLRHLRALCSAWLRLAGGGLVLAS